MRMEVALMRLITAARRKDTKPYQLARQFELTLEKIMSTSPVGHEALRLVQVNILRDVLTKDITVPVEHKKTRRSRQTGGAVLSPANGNVERKGNYPLPMRTHEEQYELGQEGGQPAKRKPGRPRKNPEVYSSRQDVIQEDWSRDVSQPVKRKPGRPRKNPEVAASQKPQEVVQENRGMGESQPAKRKPGRPRKQKSNVG